MVYRILSLDGGGIRGTAAAQMLRELEIVVRARTGQALHEYFQLIAGTSTGSILAAGLALGKSGAELVKLYEENGQRIFPYWGTKGYFAPRRLRLIWQHGLSAPKFGHDGLQTVLQEQFGDRPLAAIASDRDSHPKLLVTAYDTVERKPIVFKSWRHEEWYASVPLWEASLCSSSAPTFFPAYPLAAGGRSCAAIDGGVGANNPTTCAIAEAIRLGHPLHQLRVFSIGTGELTKSYPYREVKHWGAAQWGRRIIDVLMDAPQEIDAYVAEQIMAGTPLQQRAYARLQPPLQSSYLRAQLVHAHEWQQRLQQVFAGQTIAIDGAIDNASASNIAALAALGAVYFHHGQLTQQATSELVRDKVDNFIAAAT